MTHQEATSQWTVGNDGNTKLSTSSRNTILQDIGAEHAELDLHRADLVNLRCALDCLSADLAQTDAA